MSYEVKTGDIIRLHDDLFRVAVNHRDSDWVTVMPVKRKSGPHNQYFTTGSLRHFKRSTLEGEAALVESFEIASI